MPSAVLCICHHILSNFAADKIAYFKSLSPSPATFSVMLGQDLLGPGMPPGRGVPFRSSEQQRSFCTCSCVMNFSPLLQIHKEYLHPTHISGAWASGDWEHKCWIALCTCIMRESCARSCLPPCSPPAENQIDSRQITSNTSKLKPRSLNLS